MGKKVDDTVLDGLLGIIDNATTCHLNTAEAADRAAAISDSLGTYTPSYTGPVNGDTSGRKITHDAASSVSVTSSGTCTHLAGIDATLLLWVTTVTSQVLTSGNTVNVPAFDFEVADPT